MIKVTKIYLDHSGGGRVYIPMDMVGLLGFKNKDVLILSAEKESIVIMKEVENNEHSKEEIEE